jgi:hypothetical protein
LQPLHVAGNGQVNNVLVGDVGHGAGWAGLAHSSAASPATYGFLHSNDGKSTFLIKGSGAGTVEFRVDNATRLSMDDAGNLNLAIGGANIAVNSKHALRANDSWLRLNQDLAFTSGTHTPGLFAPMSLNVGGAGGWGKPGDGNVWITGNLGVGTTDLSHKLTVAGGDISLEAGRVFSSPGRMHINPAEILYLLPGQGVIVSRAWGGTGGLTVEGDVHLGTSDANVYIGGNQTGTFMALHDDMWLSDPQNGTIEMRNGNNTNWGTFVGFFNNKSSAAWKRDIATVESNELQRLYDDAIGTRVVHYRYRDEDESSRLRVGVIAEEAPEYVRGVDGESVSIMEYASMLHGAIQVLAQRVERLERTRRARRT